MPSQPISPPSLSLSPPSSPTSSGNDHKYDSNPSSARIERFLHKLMRLLNGQTDDHDEFDIRPFIHWDSTGAIVVVPDEASLFKHVCRRVFAQSTISSFVCSFRLIPSAERYFDAIRGHKADAALPPTSAIITPNNHPSKDKQMNNWGFLRWRPAPFEVRDMHEFEALGPRSRLWKHQTLTRSSAQEDIYSFKRKEDGMYKRRLARVRSWSVLAKSKLPSTLSPVRRSDRLRTSSGRDFREPSSSSEEDLQSQKQIYSRSGRTSHQSLAKASMNGWQSAPTSPAIPPAFIFNPSPMIRGPALENPIALRRRHSDFGLRSIYPRRYQVFRVALPSRIIPAPSAGHQAFAFDQQQGYSPPRLDLPRLGSAPYHFSSQPQPYLTSRSGLLSSFKRSPIASAPSDLTEANSIALEPPHQIRRCVTPTRSTWDESDEPSSMDEDDDWNKKRDLAAISLAKFHFAERVLPSTQIRY